MRLKLGTFAATFVTSIVALAEGEVPQASTGQAVSARVQVVIQSRNGPAVLSTLLDRLQSLRNTSNFGPVLKAKERSLALEGCVRAARQDQSGQLFDLARCVGAWPPAGKASYEKSFEKAFAKSVQRDGAYGFPDVTVTPFEFELRLQAPQFPKILLDKPFKRREREAFTLTEEFRKVLCNPAITFVDVGSCNSSVRVVPRLGVYEPDIYVPQTGYRVDINGSMGPELATELRRAILHKLKIPDNSPRALKVAVHKIEGAKSESGDAGAAAAVGSGGGLKQLWAALGVGLDSVDLGKLGDGTPPTLLVFDGPEISAPVPIREWISKLQVSEASEDSCAADATHSQAVASVLFPTALAHKLRGDAAEGRPVAQDWSGFILGAQHFSGVDVINNAPWFRRKIFADVGEPIVALTVFSKVYDKFFEGTAGNAADSYLADPSNLLVVAAAQWNKVPGVSKFRSDPTQPPRNSGDLEELCANRAWPACLGRHPRVLVVGPSEYPETGKEAVVLQPTEYVMGASTVRLLAPGGNVPVVSKCGAGARDDERPWRLLKTSGTSYAAPLVALVTSRLLQIGPPRMRHELPEAAFWRILATTTPLQVQQGQENNTLSQFGRLDAGRALRGATPSEIGPDNAAMLYEQDAQGNEVTAPAVVQPFPWMDQPLIVGAPDVQPQMRFLGRGAITLTFMKGDLPGDKETIEFDRVLRIVKRPVQDVPGNPLFDVYYISVDDPRFVMVKRRVRLGREDAIEQPGYCRSDGHPMPGDGTGRPKGQAQPACLYVMRGTGGFEGLDLNKVRDIVFPPLHYGAKPPGGVSPVDVAAMAAKGSPWRAEVCRIGPRAAAAKVLVGYEPIKLASWCAS